MSGIKYCLKCSAAMVKKDIQGKFRLSCSSEACDYIFWDSPIPVVAGIVEHEGKIILARNKSWPEKMFGLITGFLEKDEDPETGIVREVQEELGLNGEVTELIGLYPFSMMNQLIIAYHVSADGIIQLGEELSEVKSVEPTKLKPWDFGTGLAMRDWLKHHGLG